MKTNWSLVGDHQMVEGITNPEAIMRRETSQGYTTPLKLTSLLNNYIHK